MTITEFNNVHTRILTQHSFQRNLQDSCFVPKYVDFSLDTRDGSIWSMTIRQNFGRFNEEFTAYLHELDKMGLINIQGNEEIFICEPKLFQIATDILNKADECDKNG